MNTELCAVRVETLGCRLNQVESESFAALCTDAGFLVYSGTSNSELASSALEVHQAAAFSMDMVIFCLVNTCTVTGKAEQKARRLIRLLAKEHPRAVILVTGCYAQLEAGVLEGIHAHVIAFPGKQKDLLTTVPSFFAGLVRSSPSLDTAFFLSGLRSYLATLSAATTAPPIKNDVSNTKDYPEVNEQQAINDTQQLPVQKKELFALSSSRFLFHSRALLKIQDGCNNACSFCRIRLARGTSQSLPVQEVIKRLKHIEDAGISEVTLTGVNLSQYRDGTVDFADLLAIILEKIRIRIRISSLYPDRIDAALLPLLAHPQICPHFHLSVQSGSNTVLKAMCRNYTRETVYHAVSELRKIKHDPFIGVDIITGFPGETEADFEDTYRLCYELRFAGIHAFPFSARPGTEALNMQSKVPERIAGQRVKKLNTLAAEQAAAYLQAWDGKIVYGVVEAPKNNRYVVITENYLSLPLIKKSNAGSHSLSGGEYVQVKVCGNAAELLTHTVSVCS